MHARPGGGGCLNLCFHGIGDPRRPLEPGEDRYWVSESTYLDLLDLAAADPRVRISFDDGNLSDLTHGLPGLVERSLRATFFVLAGRLDQPGSLSTADVRTLVEAGMGVGSHGMEHRPWRGLSPIDAERELVVARTVLSLAAGRRVKEAALPLGRYDRRTLAELRRLGYTCVFSSDEAPARAGAWFQPRYSVRCDDTVDSIRRRVLDRPTPLRRLERTAAITAKRWR